MSDTATEQGTQEDKLWPPAIFAFGTLLFFITIWHGSNNGLGLLSVSLSIPWYEFWLPMALAMLMVLAGALGK